MKSEYWVEQNFDCGSDWVTDDWYIRGNNFKSEKEANNVLEKLLKVLEE